LLFDIFIKKAFFSGCKGRGTGAEWQKNKEAKSKKMEFAIEALKHSRNWK
jgi:hypothetical protein